MNPFGQKQLFNQFVAFTTAVHQVTHELTQNVKIDHITPVQYKILEYITVSQPVTPTEISDCQHMSLPNTSRELRKLQERKFIEKLAILRIEENTMFALRKMEKK